MPENAVRSDEQDNNQMTDPTNSTDVPVADRRRFRQTTRLVAVMFGTLVVLHLAIAASVLPYVWVSDDAANCGARRVLMRDADEMLLIGKYLLIAVALIILYTEVLEKLKPDTPYLAWLARLVEQRRLLAPKVLSVFLSVTILAMLGVVVEDVLFLRNPPTIPVDKAAQAACARPTSASSW